MKNLVRGSLALAVVIALLALPQTAAAHYTGYPHRHVYGYGYAPGVPGMPTYNIDRPGVYLGLGAMGALIINQANTNPGDPNFIDHGGGANLFFGVRIVPMFALEFGYAQTLHNPYTTVYGELDYLALHALTLDGKLIFPNRSNVRPYLQAGLGYYALTQAYADPTSGGGFQLGGGLDIWLNPWWSLGGRLLYHGVKFSTIGGAYPVAGNKPFLSYATLELNLQVHF